MQMRPYTDKEWLELPHVILTSDVEWDPSLYDDDSPTLHDLEPIPPIDYSVAQVCHHPISVQHLERCHEWGQCED